MGDVNLSNQTDGDDTGILSGLGYYGKTSAPHGWLDGDLNGDGIVDGNDLGLIIGTGTYGNGSYGPPWQEMRRRGACLIGRKGRGGKISLHFMMRRG